MPPETMQALERVTKKLGMPRTTTLAAFAAIASVDTKLREQLLKMGVALSLKM